MKLTNSTQTNHAVTLLLWIHNDWPSTGLRRIKKSIVPLYFRRKLSIPHVTNEYIWAQVENPELQRDWSLSFTKMVIMCIIGCKVSKEQERFIQELCNISCIDAIFRGGKFISTAPLNNMYNGLMML